MPVAQPVLPPESFVDLHFPAAGVDLSAAFWKQPNKPLPATGQYARTTPTGLNVRGYEPTLDRVRGGSRAGLAKYIAQPVVADWIIQQLALLVGEGYSPPGGSMQLSQSGRVVTLVAVSQGNVYVAPAGATTWTAATNNTGTTPPLNYTGVLYSTSLNQKLWFADGVNWVYYDPSINTVQRWLPSAGALPVDPRGNTPRLICTWRGRVVLSGLLFDPQNWFMSAVSDPTNFDYAPFEQAPTQAVAGNNSPLGLVGDVITGLCPYSDDTLFMFGDHTIYVLQGDPMAGGQIDLVTSSIGAAWGQAWAMDPYGTVYFVSNRMGIYSMVPGQQPVRISQQIEQTIAAYDTGLTTVRLLWNDRFQGLHVFLSPTTSPATTTHLFWELRSGAWWTDQFTNTNHDPLTCCVFDGNLPGDRAALIGSWDGYVRTVSSPTATDDDGTSISSSVVIGPLNTKDLDEILLKDIQAILGATSGDVSYAVYVGATAEVALASTAVVTGTWSASRNLLSQVRRSGHAVYIKITSTSAWSMEQIRCRIAAEGKVRRRGA